MYYKKKQNMKYIKNQILVVLLVLFAGSYSFSQEQQHVCDKTCSPFPLAVRVYAAPTQTRLIDDAFVTDQAKLGYNMGAEVLFYYLNTGKFHANIGIGIGMSRYNSMVGFNYSDSSWIRDLDNDEVFLTEKISNLEENQTVNFLNFPIKLGFEYEFAPAFEGYLNLGFTYGIVLNSEYESNATFDRTGYYPAFNLLLYDIDATNSPYYYPKSKPISGSGSIDASKNLSAEFALGVRYKINPKTSILLGFKYMHGFNHIYDSEKSKLVKHDVDYNYTILSTTAQTDKLQTRATGVEIGFQYNIGKCAKTGK